MNPLVSVIIPAYKSAKYIRESVESIEKQTYQNFEVIIVDDTEVDDGTKSIIDSFNDDRIKYIKPSSRLGLVRSLNYAIKLAKGEYIARMDADDISHIKRLEVQVDFLQSHPQIGFVGSNCYTMDTKGKITGNIEFPSQEEDIKIKLFFNNSFVHPSMMIRKQLLEEELYNENCFCCEDYEFWVRLAAKTSCYNIEQKLIKYRVFEESAMQKQLDKLQVDNEYYIKHTKVMKLIYDQNIKFFQLEDDLKGINYVDLLFTKKIDNYSLIEREDFLLKCYNLLKNNTKNTRYLKYCISYQWIKMSKKHFCSAKNKKLILWSMMVLIKSGCAKVIDICNGIVYNNKHIYDWHI